ncbi:Hypothetical predicted protein, partial [Paramuricea clavata]
RTELFRNGFRQGIETLHARPLRQASIELKHCASSKTSKKFGRLRSLCPLMTGKLPKFPNLLAIDTQCYENMMGEGKDCADIYKNGKTESGLYQIDPDGKGTFNVFCDMTTSGGGWTVFQRRLDGSVGFYRRWKDYKHGFGYLNGEFWLGLDKINRITSASHSKLRVDMEDTSGNTKYAEYDSFAIASEQQQYRLSFGTFNGTAGDSLSYQKGMAFSTYDSDNDENGSNCAREYKGAWWYKRCHHSNLNGLYLYGTHKSYADGVNWYHFKGHYYSLKSTSMKIRPSAF